MKITNVYSYPNLPLHDLKEVMLKFKEWVEPLLTKPEYEQTLKCIDEYLDSSDSLFISQNLQTRSLDKDSSWLIDWWIKYMYLSSRGPVTPECNAPMIFRNDNLSNYSLSEIISLFIYKITNIYLEVFNNHNKLINDQLTTKKNYSLDQLIYLFSSFREPNNEIDNYYTNENLSDYVIILKNNVIYKLKIIENNHLIDWNQINQAILYIQDQFASLDVNLNFITCYCNRDEAKNMLNQLLLHEQNQTVYDLIKNAIFAISLDDEAPHHPADIFKNFLSGKNFNRLHGKSLLINFSKNKDICFAADHTMVDGGTEIYLMTKVYDFLNSSPQFLNDVEFKQNLVEVFNPYISHEQQLALKLEFKNYLAYLQQVDIKTNIIERLNRSVCKKINILSPDGFIQLCFQLAQYKTNKEIKNIYVAVDVRNFFKGRTECIRPISNESKEFVIDFIDNGLKDKKAILSRLKTIFDIHYKRMKDCQNANGVNRYLLGMKLTYEENKDLFKAKPKILDCNGFLKINYNFLSTSSIISPCIAWVYFDPVVSDGLGIFYAMDENDFRYCISGWKKHHQYYLDFNKNLNLVINELLDILEGNENE